MKYLFVLLMMFLSSCATNRGINGPNGLMFEATCNGMARSMGDCYNTAGAQCPKGYRVVDGSDRTQYLNISGDEYTPIVKRSLFYECKDPRDNRSKGEVRL